MKGGEFLESLRALFASQDGLFPMDLTDQVSLTAPPLKKVSRPSAMFLFQIYPTKKKSYFPRV
jgi:hypothetical protein